MRNQQIKADNKILREIKATIKKLLETATHTVLGFASAFEKLRGAMIHHRYVIKFTDMWKSAKTFEVASLKIKVDDYSISEFDIGVWISLYAGLRIGEVCALRWSDICFDTAMLTVNGTQARMENGVEITSPKAEHQGVKYRYRKSFSKS